MCELCDSCYSYGVMAFFLLQIEGYRQRFETTAASDLAGAIASTTVVYQTLKEAEVRERV